MTALSDAVSAEDGIIVTTTMNFGNSSKIAKLVPGLA